MPTAPSPRLPINTVEELFEKLKWEEARLVDSWSVYDSWNFIVTAHHLYHDWIGGRMSKATDEQKGRRKWIQDNVHEVERFFFAMRNVADGSKHFELDRSNVIVGEISPPEVSDYDSYFFGDMIYIPYPGHRVSMFAGSAVVMRCLDWVIYGGDQHVIDELSSALAAMKDPLKP